MQTPTPTVNAIPIELALYQEQWFWAMLQFFAVLFSLGLIFWQLRLQTKTHIIQTLAVLHNRWNSSLMLRARQKACNDLLEGKTKFDGADEYVAEYLEEVGLYAQIGAISDDVLWSTMSYYVENYYLMFAKGIELMRAEYGDKLFYTNFQKLHTGMQAISARKGLPMLGVTDEQLKKFAEIETTLALKLLQDSKAKRRAKKKPQSRTP